MPSKILVDLTTAYGFLSYLTGAVKDKSSWARQNYLELTALALVGAEISIPLPRADNTGPVDDLAPLLLYFAIKSGTNLEAAAFKKEFMKAPDKVALLKQCINDLLRGAEQKNSPFSIWLSWHMKHEWPDHIQRCQGLVEDDKNKEPENTGGRNGFAEEDNVTLLAKLLAGFITREEITEINKTALKNFEGFDKLAGEKEIRLYVADVVLRGVYYEGIVTSSGLRYLPHQVRHKSISTASKHFIGLGFTPFFLAEMIRRSTKGAQRSSRVQSWLECVRTVKKAMSLNLQEFGSDNFIPEEWRKFETAMHEAKRLAKRHIAWNDSLVKRWTYVLASIVGPVATSAAAFFASGCGTMWMIVSSALSGLLSSAIVLGIGALLQLIMRTVVPWKVGCDFSRRMPPTIELWGDEE